MRIFAVAGVVVLYLIVKFLPVPGVPCEVSAAKECAPSNDTIAYVPRDAVLYAHVTVNSDSHQWELAGDLRDALPNFTALLQSDTSALATPAGRPDRPLPGGPALGQGRPGAARCPGAEGDHGRGLHRRRRGRRQGEPVPGRPLARRQGQAGEGRRRQLNVYAGGFATARSGDQLLFGNVAAVRAALNAEQGHAPRLEGSAQDTARDELPERALAEIYLSQAGVRRFLAGASGHGDPARHLRRLRRDHRHGRLCAARDDGVEVDLVSEPRPEARAGSPTVFASLPQFSARAWRTRRAPSALGYIGVGDLGPALNKALATAGAGAQGLAGSLRALAQSLQQQAGVDPLKDLLPALGGQAALVAEPTGRRALREPDRRRGGREEGDGRAGLPAGRRWCTRSGRGGPQVPSFQSKEVDGVNVHSVQVSPSVDLSYAVFDGKLVVSTQPAGIAQVRSSGDDLAGNGRLPGGDQPAPRPGLGASLPQPRRGPGVGAAGRPGGGSTVCLAQRRHLARSVPRPRRERERRRASIRALPGHQPLRKTPCNSFPRTSSCSPPSRSPRAIPTRSATRSPTASSTP